MHKDWFEERGLSIALKTLNEGLVDAAVAQLREVNGLIAGECVSLLRDGHHDEAALRMSRWLGPKWHSEAQCAEAYSKVMGASA